MAWISVRNWRKFQHYDPEQRNVKWVKNYTQLLSSDDYLGLTPARRALLHGLWMVYGLACTCPRDRDDLACTCLRLDVQLLNRRLGLAAKMADYESLNQAGFIHILASNTLAIGYQVASPKRARVEVEEEKEQPPSLPTWSRPAEGTEETNNGQNDFPIPLPVLRDFPA